MSIDLRLCKKIMNYISSFLLYRGMPNCSWLTQINFYQFIQKISYFEFAPFDFIYQTFCFMKEQIKYSLLAGANSSAENQNFDYNLCLSRPSKKKEVVVSAIRSQSGYQVAITKLQTMTRFMAIPGNKLFLFLPLIAFQDAPEDWQMGFQDPATPVMQGIIDLHHDICFFLLVILVFVLWMLSRTLYHFQQNFNPIPEKILHGTTVEIAWTVAPSLILVFIAIPSFALLYSIDEVVDPAVTVKAIGHQWYWSYEYSDYNPSDSQVLAFDSYMIPEDDLEAGQLRILEVDNRVVLPVNTQIRMIITSADVLHSWAIPSLGVKCDAVPGRLNQTPLFIKREGVFYGQCSELCGANHAFMPIVVEAVKLKDYIAWVSTKLQEA